MSPPFTHSLTHTHTHSHTLTLTHTHTLTHSHSHTLTLTLTHSHTVYGVELTTLVKLHGTKVPVVVKDCIEEIETRGKENKHWVLVYTCNH